MSTIKILLSEIKEHYCRSSPYFPYAPQMSPLTETIIMLTGFTKNINIFLLYHPELDIKLKFMRML